MQSLNRTPLDDIHIDYIEEPLPRQYQRVNWSTKIREKFWPTISRRN